MNKIELFMKNPTQAKKEDLYLLRQLQYCQVFIGVGINIWFIIPFIISFQYFEKFSILKTFKKPTPIIMVSSET